MVDPAGDRVYARDSDFVDVFPYNSATGVLGTAPLFSIPISGASTFYGVDQMAISADGTELYVSQPNALDVYNAATGALVATITAPDIVSPTGVAVSGGQPQLFAGEPKVPAPGTADLTQAQLQPVVTQAIAQLATAGYNVSSLGQVDFHIVSLPGSLLGLTNQDTIWIDQNAQGYGWYVDASPSSNAAFTQVTSTNEVQAAPGSPAYGHVDLLTVVTHELGHVLGFGRIDPGILGHDWMTATLGTGVRRYPDAAQGSEPPSVLGTLALTATYQSPAGGTGALGSAPPVVATSLVPPSGPTPLANPAQFVQRPELNQAENSSISREGDVVTIAGSTSTSFPLVRRSNNRRLLTDLHQERSDSKPFWS